MNANLLRNNFFIFSETHQDQFFIYRLNSGIYFLKLKTNQKTTIHKFIKQ
ncbi:MAG: T9SS type A sorting domain-containing protein [Bacteroidetes bacterium]|nr:T9SS type A sorting domain-containing protein [Bacteroidota bacterium]MBK7430462.1 T9SS type A sorting domain-containing protein [Bacteroidota bacterium]MBK7573162.1 T9SS type A sorting domain-containing protein [Bacteroidota bacterium]MBP9789498.1 T9SS type A sorting domain-containing protein [Bacteroidia bacterium]